MFTPRQIDWLSGYFEGEGSFYSSRWGSPSIALSTTDHDIALKVAQALKIPVYTAKKRPGCKILYKLGLVGASAAGWMMTLYSGLGFRRQRKIKEVLAVWRTTQPRLRGWEAYKRRLGIADGFCLHGHVYEPITKSDGRKNCRLCDNNSSARRWRERKKTLSASTRIPFGRKDGKLWEFTPEQRGKIVAAKEARKKELGGK